MRFAVKSLLILTATLSVAAFEAQAFVNQPDRSVYEPIVHRNVFDLHGPPKKAEPPPDVPPPTKIRLTGITTILGDKRALLMVQEPTTPGPGTPPAKEESVILSEGQRQGGIQLLEVNPTAGTVKLESDGKISTVALEIPKPGTTAAAPPSAPIAPMQHASSRSPHSQPPPLPLSLYN
jgi:hypothetical protein